jgi:hypoxanthine phosphoribosyltransferase
VKLRDDLIPFLTHDEIQKMVKALARQVESDFEGQEIILVAPLRGSIHLVADLSREIRNLQQVEFVQLKTLGKRGSIQIVKDIGVSITGKNVIIVEEIIDSGRTLSFLYNHLLSNSPASLKILALLDKPARREIPLTPDYCGKVIDDRYVVGYGMDSEEMGRHFPDIYLLKN